MQYSNIFYARQPVYGQEIFCYIMVMRHKDIEKIFKNLEKNALSIARKMYDYNLDDDLHDFCQYKNWQERKYVVWIDVTDPRPGRTRFACWKVYGEVFVDEAGNKTYKIRFPLSKNTEEYHPCSQTLSGMMREMEEYRREYIRDGYMKLCNAAIEQIIESLP